MDPCARINATNTEDAGFFRCRGRARPPQKRREAYGLFSESLFLTIGLFLLLSNATLSGISGKGVALAFSFSSHTKRMSSTIISSRDSSWDHGRRISGRIRNYNDCRDGCGRTPPSGPQTRFQKNHWQHFHAALSSTTETSDETAIDEIITDNQRQKVPRHVGLICDGNGRWATQRNLPRALGHLEGARRLVDLIRSLVIERKSFQKQQEQPSKPANAKKNVSANGNANAVDFLTLYAFSTENWNRSPSEITKIFEAIEFAATTIQMSGDLAGVDLRVLGDLSDDRIPGSLKKVLGQLEKRTQQRRDKQNEGEENNRLEVCLAINYGGRRDIVAACRAMAEEVRDGSLEASAITEESLQSRLGTGGTPPPDLIVRTGGEYRLSNFLLWESAYAELFVSQVLWPDFSWEDEWNRSLDWYATRKRNFGGRKDEENENENENK